AAPLFLPSVLAYVHADNRHGVIAEDVHHLHGDLAPSWRAFVEDAFKFQRPFLLRAEALPLVLEDVVACPEFFPFAGFFILHPDNFPFVLKVEVYRPVVNPVGPVLSEHLAGDDAVLVLAHLDYLTLLRHDPAALVFNGGLRVGNGVLRVEHRKVSQFYRNGILCNVRFDLDVGHVMEHHLVLFHRPFVEDFGGDVFGRDVDPFCPRLIKHIREQAHLKLEAEDVHLCDVLLAAFQDDFLDEQPRHRQVHRPDGHQPPRLLPVEADEAFRLLRPVGPQDQVEERSLFFFELLLLIRLAQVGINADIMLALVLSKIEDFKGPVVLAIFLQLPLHANHSLTRSVYGELPQIADYPLTTQLFSDSGCCS